MSITLLRALAASVTGRRRAGVVFPNPEVTSMGKIKTEAVAAEWLSDGIDCEEARAAFRNWMWRGRDDELECRVKEGWLEALRCYEEERLH